LPIRFWLKGFAVTDDNDTPQDIAEKISATKMAMIPTWKILRMIYSWLPFNQQGRASFL